MQSLHEVQSILETFMTIATLQQRLGYECGVEFNNYTNFSILTGHVWNYCKIEDDYYYFDEDGQMVIPELRNGVVDDCLYIDDVKQLAYQLVEYDGSFYFINDGSHRIARDITLYLSERFVSGKTFANGEAIQPGLYYFGEDGKMVVPETLNGVVGDCLYINGVKQRAYQLVEYNGDFYFINDGNHRIARNTKLYLSEEFVEGKTFADGKAIQPGFYYFDEEGKMIIPEIKNGVVDGYFYIDGIKQTAYQLVEYEGNFYFISDGNKVAKNITLFMGERFVTGKTLENGRTMLIGYYKFDSEGRMITEH